MSDTPAELNPFAILPTDYPDPPAPEPAPCQRCLELQAGLQQAAAALEWAAGLEAQTLPDPTRTKCGTAAAAARALAGGETLPWMEELRELRAKDVTLVVERGAATGRAADIADAEAGKFEKSAAEHKQLGNTISAVQHQRLANQSRRIACLIRGRGV